jgi:hypothetical protein
VARESRLRLIGCVTPASTTQPMLIMHRKSLRDIREEIFGTRSGTKEGATEKVRE